MNKICYYLFGINPLLYIYLTLPAIIFYDRLVKLLGNKYFRIFLLLILPTIIFIQIFRNDPFFYSDDLAMLGVVYKSSYWDIARLTLSGPGIWVGHRYVLGLWVLKTIYVLFGANITPYILSLYLLNVLAVILFYIFMQKLVKIKTLSLFISIVFSGFYLWTISTIYELMAGIFILLIILFWLRWLSDKRKKWAILSLTSYILAILSKEIAFLFIPALFVLTISINNFLTKVNFKKSFLPFPFFLTVFIIYGVFFTGSFYRYFSITQGTGYSMSLTLGNIRSNLVYYTSSLFPFLLGKSPLVFLFLLIFPILDFFKKKMVYTPFLFTYLGLIAPPLLFNARVGTYYAYIPSMFLYAAFGLLLKDLWERAKPTFGKNQKKALRYMVLPLAIFFLLFGFGIQRLLLDNCFLIQYPWNKLYKAPFYSLVKRVDDGFKLGQIKNGDTIALSREENTPETESVFYNDAFAAFLTDDKAQRANYTYDDILKVIKVEIKEQ
jgi:hypothetical protein